MHENYLVKSGSAAEMTTEMTTDIMKSLQDDFEKAKDDLKSMDEQIKKLTGREPGDMPTRLGVKRPATNAPEEFRGRGRGFPSMRGRPGGRAEEDEPPATRKRPGDSRTVFSRLSAQTVPKRADSDVEDELPNKPAISSRVIATPKEPPSRQEAMAAQSSDQRSRERNRRMFGALLGTLQKFRQEETRMKEKEEKRAKVERKLEENAKREKEELKRERQELFLERKRKQAEIRKIEIKMLRIKEHDEWEAQQRQHMNFIRTRTKPHIFYFPKTHTPKTEERLVASQKIVAKLIEKKRAELRQELEAIERRGRWRQGLGDAEPGQHSDDEHPMDLADEENPLSLLETSHKSEISAVNQGGAVGVAVAAAAMAVAVGDAKAAGDSCSAAAAAPGDAPVAAAGNKVTAPAAGDGGAEANANAQAEGGPMEKDDSSATRPLRPLREASVEETSPARHRLRRGASERTARRHRRDDEDNSEGDEDEEWSPRTSPFPVPAPDATSAVPLPQREPRRGRDRRESSASSASAPSPPPSPLPSPPPAPAQEECPVSVAEAAAAAAAATLEAALAAAVGEAMPCLLPSQNPSPPPILPEGKDHLLVASTGERQPPQASMAIEVEMGQESAEAPMEVDSEEGEESRTMEQPPVPGEDIDTELWQRQRIP